MQELLVHSNWPAILDDLLRRYGGHVVVAEDGHYLRVEPGVYVVRAFPSQSLDFLRAVISSAGGSGRSAAPGSRYGTVVGEREMDAADEPWTTQGSRSTQREGGA